jgi:large repetitive protein
VEVKPDVSSDNYSFAILTTNDPNNIPASEYKPSDAGTPKIHTFHNLIPGLTYTFIVKDNATGCYYIKTADIPIPTLSNLAIVKDIVTNVTCTNANDGTAKFTFSGFDAGATDISYEVYYAQSNIPVTPIVPPALPPSVPVAAGEVSVSGLAPGIYFILFKEIGGIHDGCSVVSEQFTISESLKLLVPSAVVTKNDNCNTKAGIITASANHGTGPYTYELKLATAAISIS